MEAACGVTPVVPTLAGVGLYGRRWSLYQICSRGRRSTAHAGGIGSEAENPSMDAQRICRGLRGDSHAPAQPCCCCSLSPGGQREQSIIMSPAPSRNDLAAVPVIVGIVLLIMLMCRVNLRLLSHKSRRCRGWLATIVADLSCGVKSVYIEPLS